MNFKHIWIVFSKEIKDSFRDRKSMMSNIFLPLVLIPLIYFCMNFFMKSSSKEVEDNMKIAITTNDSMSEAEVFTKNSIIGEDKIELVTFNGSEEAKKALLDGEINCILNYQDGFFSNIQQDNSAGIKLEYSSIKNSSQLGMQMLQSKLMLLNQTLASDKLTRMNISTEILNLVNIDVVDSSTEISENGKSSNQMLMMIIPMYLVIIIVTAGVPIAIDVLAGERERNTFEALLSTKANRLSILLGKYLAILVFSVIAIIMSFIGLIIGMVMNPEMFSTGEQVMTLGTVFASLNMPVGAFLLVLLSAITLAIVFAGIQIGLSTYAKTVKEAQTYLSYLMFPAMILGFATMFMGAGDMKPFMAFIPVFNTIASLKMSLGGIIDYPFLLIGVATNIVFTVLVTTCIIKMFRNEKVIIK